MRNDASGWPWRVQKWPEWTLDVFMGNNMGKWLILAPFLYSYTTHIQIHVSIWSSVWLHFSPVLFYLIQNLNEFGQEQRQLQSAHILYSVTILNKPIFITTINIKIAGILPYKDESNYQLKIVYYNSRQALHSTINIQLQRLHVKKISHLTVLLSFRKWKQTKYIMNVHWILRTL